MRQAAALYEEKLAGRLPGDYLEAVSDERRMLRELARNGWSERLEIPRETLVKYGLAEVFSEIRLAAVGLPPKPGQRRSFP